MGPYHPLVVFVLAVLAVLLVTAPDRRDQLVRIRAAAENIARSRHRPLHSLGNLLSLKRVIQAVVILLLGTYIWTYQSIKAEVRALLVEHEIEGVEVGSLVIPYTAFFRGEFIADTGFSKKKHRTRADIDVTDSPWSRPELHISEIEFAKINRVVGRTISFSYLTDVEVLKPAISEHMKRLIRNKQIDAFEIETFDNQGPYMFVVLSENNRDKDVNAVAKSIAESLYVNLTKTKKLQVNRVVVKVVDPGPYNDDRRIKIIGRGKAGQA